MGPRITFGMIVLNGEPFLRYNLRALYPHAHQIVVVEGASPKAAHAASPEGHSVDGTLEALRRFKAEEDPEGKLLIVTAEDEGLPDGFWPGEKDQQSQAYARRATGDWLWQVDADEFYMPEDLARAAAFLAAHPEISCLTVDAFHFWGGFDYALEGGLYRSWSFAGEPWGAIRRIFRWGPGMRYVTHRPPTVHDARGRDLAHIRKVSLSRRLPGLRMFHYTNVFPAQVLPKGAYYAALGQTAERRKFEAFLQPLDWRRALRIYDHYGTYNWLRPFRRPHPPAIEALRRDLASGAVSMELRRVDDIERALASPRYRAAVVGLRGLELGRACYRHAWSAARIGAMRALCVVLPPAVRPALPRSLQLRLARYHRVR